MSEKKEKRELDPLVMSKPDPDKILCKDCIFRDKTTVKLGNDEIKVGITKAECEIYQKPNYKLSEILFQNGDCRYYVKDKDK